MGQQNFQIDDEIGRQLRVLCANRGGMTLSESANAALLQFLEMNDEQRVEAFEKLRAFREGQAASSARQPRRAAARDKPQPRGRKRGEARE